MKIDKNLKITMSRRQLCKLILALDAIQIVSESCAGSAEGWKNIRDELQSILEQYDDINFKRYKGGKNNENNV